MVLVHLDDTRGEGDRGGEQQIWPSYKGQANGDGFRSYQIAGLASDQPSTATGMRDEILLVSWLIVLLRTREDGQVRYDWAYKGQATGAEGHGPANTLSTDQVMPSLQTSIQQVAEAVSSHVANAIPGQYTTESGPASLLLSTGPLSQTSEDAKDEVSEWFHLVRQNPSG